MLGVTGSGVEGGGEAPRGHNNERDFVRRYEAWRVLLQEDATDLAARVRTWVAECIMITACALAVDSVTAEWKLSLAAITSTVLNDPQHHTCQTPAALSGARSCGHCRGARGAARERPGPRPRLAAARAYRDASHWPRADGS